MMFTKILIANRGEIACRIIRTARMMGIKTVAVYSDADAHSLHVCEADEAVHIGPSPSRMSYLCGDKIIQAALDTGAQAIHPGYGLLSENPDFVEAVEAAGLVFIGPSGSAIRAMGLKDAAKKLMEEAGVPVVPGYHGDNQDTEFLRGQAETIGYPVLIKARAGGGGKGMRKVERAEDFDAALEGAVREGEASFGDGHVLIEKYISSPRHIEIQVFGDSHGNVVHLFERDCSLQRRHQKVIEEAPAPSMSEEMRQVMGGAAVKAAKTINYCGAGTIEFIVDGSNGLDQNKFWFMEMNTRLQVEHPVTEAITGLDLVEWQLRVASGETLPKTQDELAINGHAFEARLYAEDVPKGFLPAIGTLEHLAFSEVARNDSGVRSGDMITPFYDPMIAKVIVHGASRDEAMATMRTALSETQIAGTTTNLEFLSALMAHEGFGKAQVDTGLIDRDLDQLVCVGEPTPEHLALAALIASGALEQSQNNDPFVVLKSFAHWHQTPFTIHLEQGENHSTQKVLQNTKNNWLVSCEGNEMLLTDVQLENNSVRYTCLGLVKQCAFFCSPNAVTLFVDGRSHAFMIPDPLAVGADDHSKANAIIAPMPGLVKQVLAKAGANVSQGDALVVLEAMKMEHSLLASRDGKIAGVNVAEGDQVEDGMELVTLKPVEEDDG